MIGVCNAVKHSRIKRIVLCTCNAERSMKKRDAVEQKGRHRSLVERLRTPDQPGEDYFTHLADKVEAMAEALAYLIEKKHMKKHVKQRGG
jgi:hypothetical protein